MSLYLFTMHVPVEHKLLLHTYNSLLHLVLPSSTNRKSIEHLYKYLFSAKSYNLYIFSGTVFCTLLFVENIKKESYSSGSRDMKAMHCQKKLVPCTNIFQRVSFEYLINDTSVSHKNLRDMSKNYRLFTTTFAPHVLILQRQDKHM